MRSEFNYKTKIDYIHETGVAESSETILKGFSIPNDNSLVQLFVPYFKGLNAANIDMEINYKLDIGDANSSFNFMINAKEWAKLSYGFIINDYDNKALIKAINGEDKVSLEKFGSFGKNSYIDNINLKIENANIVDHTIEYFSYQTGSSTSDIKKTFISSLEFLLKNGLSAPSADNIIYGVKKFIDDPKDIEINLKPGSKLPFSKYYSHYGDFSEIFTEIISPGLKKLEFEVRVNK